LNEWVRISLAPGGAQDIPAPLGASVIVAGRGIGSPGALNAEARSGEHRNKPGRAARRRRCLYVSGGYKRLGGRSHDGCTSIKKQVDSCSVVLCSRVSLKI